MNTSPRTAPQWTVASLFSGAGCAGIGFRGQTAFNIIAAADAQVGKPSSRQVTLGCNDTYHHHIGIRPAQASLAGASGQALPDLLGNSASPTMLIACPPCTGFSRMVTANHHLDDPRNSLVTKVGDFVAVVTPATVIMETARELITGRFARHHRVLAGKRRMLRYHVHSAIHILTRFKLPLARKRAVILTCRHPSITELVVPGTTLRADNITGDPADHGATPSSASIHGPLVCRDWFGHRAVPMPDTAAR